jgi:hypothetical protein
MNDPVNQRDIANTNSQSYMNSRTDIGCSGTMNPASTAAESVGLIPTAGYGMAAGGCTVDLNTELTWGVPGGHREKGPKQLWARPFTTTPNLGGGNPADVDHESQLIQSASIRNRKETNTISDKTIPHFFSPLLEEKAEEQRDTSNWIEGWTRGGDNTRLIPVKRVASE